MCPGGCYRELRICCARTFDQKQRNSAQVGLWRRPFEPEGAPAPFYRSSPYVVLVCFMCEYL